jgi:hypothetical protein
VCRGCVEGEGEGDGGGDSDGEKAAAVQPLLETIGTELIQESAVTNMAKGSSLALVLLAAGCWRIPGLAKLLRSFGTNDAQTFFT